MRRQARRCPTELEGATAEREPDRQEVALTQGRFHGSNLIGVRLHFGFMLSDALRKCGLTFGQSRVSGLQRGRGFATCTFWCAKALASASSSLARAFAARSVFLDKRS